MADLDRVLQQILRKGRTKLEPSEREHQLGVQLVQAEVEDGLLAGFAALQINLLLALLDELLVFAGHFLAPVRRQTMHEDGVRLSQRKQLAVYLETIEVPQAL